MGFTKKSLLAMVLALVMVIGMAMPTALAAPADDGTATISFEIDGTPVADGDTDATPHAFTAGGKAIKLDMFDGTDPLTAKFLGAAPKVTVVNQDDSLISITKGDGYLTITPGTTFQGVSSFTVTVEAPKADADWGPDANWSPEAYYEATFYYEVFPSLKYSAASLYLDIYTKKTPLEVTKVMAFSATPSDAIVIDGFGDDDTANDGVTFSGNGIDVVISNGVVLATGSAKGEGDFYVYSHVGVREAAPVKVHYVVGDSAPSFPYKVVATPATLSLDRNAAISARKFDVAIKDVAGNKPTKDTAALAALDITNVDFEVASVTKIDPAVVGAAAITNIFDAAPVVNEEGTATFAFATGLISFDGVIRATYTDATNNTLVSADIPLKVNPIELGSSSDLVLNYDLKQLATANVQKVTFTAKPTVAGKTGPDCTFTLAGTMPDGVSYYFDDDTTNQVSGSKVTFLADITDVDLAPAEAKITLTGTTKTGSIGCPELKFNLVVKNNTPKASVSGKVGSTALKANDKIVLDLYANNGSAEKTITFTGAGGLGVNPADKVISDLDVVASTSLSGVITGAAVGTDGWKLTAVKRGTGYVTVKSLVGGIPAAEVVYQIEVIDKAPNQVNSITGPAKVEMTITDDSAFMTFKAFDVDNTFMQTETGTLVFSYLNDKGKEITVAADEFLTITSTNPATGQFAVAPKTTGTGTLVVMDAASKSAPIKIPVTVHGVKVTATPNSLTTLNLKSELNSKVSIKLGVPTALANEALTLTIADTNTGSNFDEAWNAAYDDATKTITNLATVVGKGKLTLTGTIKGYAFDKIEIPYEIKNDKAITSVPAIANMAFEMRVGGNQDTTLEFRPNPSSAELELASVTSSDEGIVSVSMVNDTTYKFTALKAGSGTVAVKGKVGGTAVADLVIPFSVTGDDVKPSLTVSPSGAVALSLKEGGKISETFTITSPNGAIDSGTLVFTASKAGIVDLPTAEPWTVTAKAQGSTVLTVTAKVNGKDAAPATINVNVDTTIVTSDFMLDGVAATTTSLQLQNSANNQRKLTLNGVTGAVKWKTSDKSIVKFISAPAGKASQTVDGTADQWIQVLKTGKVTITATPTLAGATAKSIRFTIITQPETGFTIPANSSLVIGQRMSAYPAIVPATAKTKGFTFKSYTPSVASVTSSGTITAKKAGTALIRVKQKKKGGTYQEFTVTVLADYSTVKFNSIALLQNSGTLTNKDTAELKTILDSAKFVDTAASNAANMLPAAATKTDVENAIKAVVAGDNDVTVFYFSGTAAASTGLALGGNTSMTFGELANNLAAIKGNIVVFLDCKGGSRMINTKATSESDIFAAFAKASKVAGLKEANKTMRPKFTVFTATDKGSRALGAGTSTTTEYSSKFTSAFVAALRTDATTKKMLADTNGDGRVTVKELRTALIKKSAAGKYVKVYSSYKSVLPIYANVQAPVVPAT